MPEFEGGNFGSDEREWGKEIGGEKSYEENWDETEAILEKFITEFSANTSLIPIEDYDGYLEAAKMYQEMAELHPGDINRKLLIAADNIINEAPIE